MPAGTIEQRKSWTSKDYMDRLAEIRVDFTDLTGKDQKLPETRSSFKALMDEREYLDAEYRIARLQDGYRLPAEANAEAPPGALSGIGTEVEHRSPGEIITRDSAFAEWIKRGAKGESPTVEIRGPFAMAHRDTKFYETRALVSETLSTSDGGNLLAPVGQPFLGNIWQRKLFIRDVLAGGQTTLGAIPYVRELNVTANQWGASNVTEAAVKPEAVLQFEPDTALAQVIAVTLPVTNQIAEDAPSLMSYIDARLSYMVALREEQQILSGSGTTPQLKGIRSYSIQTQAYTSTDIAITLGQAISKIMQVDGFPNAVALNPVDHWSMKTKRAAGGSGTFDAGDPFSSVLNTVWGIPVVPTNSIEAGKGLVGDYAQGAQYFDRSRTEVRSFEQHSDYAARNMRLLRAEERLALAVYRADYFCLATLA